MYSPRVLVLLLSCALIACSGAPEPATIPAQEATDAQAEIAEHVVPVVAEVRDVVAEIAPPAPTIDCYVTPEAVELLVAFEVSSQGYYTAKLESPIWPGLHSGVTWGIGYDGGYQTRARIAEDWHLHVQVDRLTATAGISGEPAKALILGLRDVKVPYRMAVDVFADSVLPTYCLLTKRTFRDGWELLPQSAKDSLVLTVFNRGASTTGSRRAEMRTIKDQCAPAGDGACVVQQLRLMPRIWVGTSVERGLRDRYERTAEHAERDL